ncbi:MAG: type IV pilus secretin PilQ [Mariprofundales bacterium]
MSGIERGIHMRVGMVMWWLAVALLVPGLSVASVLDRLQLVTDASGDTLTVQSDVAAPYQVFDLDGPPRLVLNFPATTIGALQIPPKGRVVAAVRASQQGDAAVVEVTLLQQVKYAIKENGKALVIHFPAMAAASSEVVTAKIDDLSVVDRGETTELRLRGTHLDLPFSSHIVNQGMTMMIDMPNAQSRLAKEHFSFPSRFVRSVIVGSSEGSTRLVVALLKANPGYQMHAASGELVLRFADSLAEKVEAGKAMVERIQFRPQDRISHILLTMDTSTPIVDLQQTDSAIKLTIVGLRLKKGLERTMDVSEFPGTVKQIDAFQDGDKVRVVIRLRKDEKVSVSTFQRGKVLAVNIEPQALTAARAGAGGDNRFTFVGDKVTFDFKDIEVVNALRLIAQMSNLNIIMSDDVSGKLTMRLVDVPWDQALDLILTSKGLGQEKVGNVLRIAPIATLRGEYKTRLAVQKGSEALEPLVTEFITLNFTKVAAVKAMIASAAANATKVAAATAGKGASAAKGSSAGILSSRGSILTDDRTNTLIVNDTQPSIDNVKRLIMAIDQPVRQVLIAARVVEATSDFNQDIGIQWGGVYNAQSQQNFPGAISVGQPAAAQTNAAAIAGGGGIVAAAAKGFLVDLPAAAANGAIGISLGSFNNAINLDLALSAAELNGSAKVVSNPRIVTTNLKPATISQGTKIAVVTGQGANNAATTTYVDATLNLTVTPQITSKDTVLMDVQISKDSPVGTSSNINTKTVTTNVNVKSGETVVIGGVYERTRAQTKNSVPLLASIPVLGWLFQKNAEIDNRTELLIFITPQIMQNAVTGGER